MNNQTTGFFIVVCLFVNRFRSTKTFFKTKHNSEKFSEVLTNGYIRSRDMYCSKNKDTL